MRPRLIYCAACGISGISIRAALDNTKRLRMAAISRTKTYAARQTIIDEGEPAELLFNITGGPVNIAQTSTR